MRSLARKNRPCQRQGDNAGLPGESPQTSLCPRAAPASLRPRALPPPPLRAVATLCVASADATWAFQSHLPAALAGEGAAGRGCKGLMSGFPGPTRCLGMGGGGSQCLTSVSHPRPKNKGFIDLNPDPCSSNHPQPTSHNQHSLILASSRSVRTKQKGLIYTNMGRPGSGKFGGPRGRVWAPVTLNPRAGRVQRMGSCEYSGHPEK